MNDEELTHHVVHEIIYLQLCMKSIYLLLCIKEVNLSPVVRKSIYLLLCMKSIYQICLVCVRACVHSSLFLVKASIAEKRIIIIMPAEILYRRMDKSGLYSNSILMSDVVLTSIIESVYTSISTKAAAVLLLVSA